MSNWDIKKDTKLQEFIVELTRSYLQYQKEKLQSYDQIKEEFQTFFEEHPELANECEIQITKGGQKAHVSVFLFLSWPLQKVTTFTEEGRDPVISFQK